MSSQTRFNSMNIAEVSVILVKLRNIYTVEEILVGVVEFDGGLTLIPKAAYKTLHNCQY